MPASCPMTSRAMTFQFLSLIFKFSPLSPQERVQQQPVVEQNVDIPVPGGRGSSACGGLQGFHSK